MVMVRLEPILYRVVTLTREGEARRFITCLHRRESPRSFAHAAVKSLCIYDRILGTTALEILYDCTGVTSLAIWIITAAPVLMQEHINTLPLKKLSLHMTSVFSTPPSFTMLGIAQVITHLEILEGWTLSTETIGIKGLTQLTHLSLPLDLHSSCPKHFQRILHHCFNLKVLILRSAKSQNSVNAWLEVHDIHDIHTVWTNESPWRDWFPPNNNHHNLWDCRGDIVAWRRQMKGMCQDMQHIVLTGKFSQSI